MKRIKSIDTSVIVLILVIVLGFGAIYLVGNMIRTNEQAREEIYLSIQGEYLRREKYKEILALQQEIKSKGVSDKLTETLPSQENFLDVIKELENIAYLSGNRIAMSLGDAKITSDALEIETDSRGGAVTSTLSINGRNYDYVSVEVSLRGNYNELIQFLNLFDQAKYFMNIDTISVNSIKTERGRQIDTHMEIKIFVEKVLVS